MPMVKELNVQVKDRPGTLGRLSRALAERGVNILAFQASSFEPQTQVHLIVDNLIAAKTVLNAEGWAYTEAEVARVSAPQRPGELARASLRLGEANININYAYGGIDPVTNAPVIFFGVAEVGSAAKILDQAAAIAASI